MVTVQALAVTQGFQTISVNILDPATCPLCHCGIQSISTGNGFYDSGPVPADQGGIQPIDLQVVFRCPRPECHRLFIARFKRSGRTANVQLIDYWEPQTLEPRAYTPRQFPAEIGRTSQSFLDIYGQAAKADADGLDQLSGPGYRKALEFLVKDYVKTLPENKAKEGDIDNCPLGSCISQFVKDANIKSCAKRSAWLGNDETHYVRKWVDKDLSDLKKLIDLTLHWISAEILTRELEQSMPESASRAVLGP